MLKFINTKNLIKALVFSAIAGIVVVVVLFFINLHTFRKDVAVAFSQHALIINAQAKRLDAVNRFMEMNFPDEVKEFNDLVKAENTPAQ